MPNGISFLLSFHTLQEPIETLKAVASIEATRRVCAACSGLHSGVPFGRSDTLPGLFSGPQVSCMQYNLLQIIQSIDIMETKDESCEYLGSG